MMGLFAKKTEDLEKGLPEFSRTDEFPAYEPEFKLPEKLNFQNSSQAAGSIEKFRIPYDETPRLPSEFQDIREPIRPDTQEEVMRPYSNEKPLFIKVENSRTQ
ncbi:hypothetical protein HYT58_00275 [Candidatus Woesearchaeota archaeon]|nr:hypothetical protein [Candidatus Woesearchaeota archaeon]